MYSDQESLINWMIKITGKNGRDTKTVLNVFPTPFRTSNKRYLLEWECPILSSIEYDYEITADTEIIDKGILRYGNF
jgi:hypothetical protein